MLEAVLLQLRSSPLHGPLLQACPGGLLKWQACHPGLKRGVRCCGSSLAPACPGGLLYWQACPQGRRVRDLNVPLATPLQWRAPRLTLANPLQWRVLCCRWQIRCNGGWSRHSVRWIHFGCQVKPDQGCKGDRF